MEIYRSNARFLMVSLPPDQFGMGLDAEGKPAPWPAQRFKDNELEVKSDIVNEMLKKHAAYGTEFWLLGSEAKSAGAASFGKLVINTEDREVSDEDLIALKVLENATLKPIDKNRVQPIHQKLVYVVKRFEIMGFLLPAKNVKPRTLQADIVRILDVLEDEEIWGGSDGR